MRIICSNPRPLTKEKDGNTYPVSFTESISLPRYENSKHNENNQPPSLIQQAKNFATSVTRHVMAGMPQVSDEERSSRMAICKGCPLFNREDPENPKCNECGCYLKIKTSWALESCPQKRWGPATVNKNCGCGG